MEKTIYNHYTENIKFNYRTSLDQSNTFTRFHTRYNVRLTNLVNNQSVCFEYQCNPKYNKPSKINCLWAYLMDAQSYYYANGDLDAFAADLDIQKPSEAFKVFNACKKAYNDLVNFFGSEKNAPCIHGSVPRILEKGGKRNETLRTFVRGLFSKR